MSFDQGHGLLTGVKFQGERMHPIERRGVDLCTERPVCRAARG
jgi:hypothetical protein